MRAILAVVMLALAAVLVGGATGGAKEGKKEVKLEGKITCAKCDLKETAACATVIVANDKTYYFDKASSKKYHGKICTTPKEGTVTGTVSKEGDKEVVTVESVEFKE